MIIKYIYAAIYNITEDITAIISAEQKLDASVVIFHNEDANASQGASRSSVHNILPSVSFGV